MRRLANSRIREQIGPVADLPKQPLTFLGRTTFRNKQRLFGIHDADRRHHIYLVGQTGTGKSTLLEALIRQDLVNGKGFALIEPHGDLVDWVANKCPSSLRDRVQYLDVASTAPAFTFNPLRALPGTREIAAAGILGVFKKIWQDSWGPRLEHLLRYALLALVELPDSTLGDILRMLEDDEFRRETARDVGNPQVRRFWLREYEHYSPGRRAEAMGPVQNKVGAFLAHPALQRVLAGDRPALDVRRLMDAGGALLINLSKGRLGEDAGALLGALLVSTIARVGLERADQPEADRRDFAVYLDEFQTFVTLGLAEMLAELRKYHVSLVLAHQYLEQVDLEIREAILSNVGTLVVFRVGPTDAKVLLPILGADLEAADLLRLPNHHAYVRLLVNGAPVQAFSAETLRL